MAVTTIAEVQELLQTVVAPLVLKKLLAQSKLPALVNRDYEGQIREKNDTVKVSQINPPAGQDGVAADMDSFETEELSITQVEVKADRRAVAAYEFSDLVSFKTKITSGDPTVRDAMAHTLATKINNYLYSIVKPSESSPDHVVNGVTNFNATQVAAVRLLASVARWSKDKPWYISADPSYFSDLLSDTTIAGADYGATDRPMIGGEFAIPRLGFQMFEDNTDGIAASVCGTSGVDGALAFHPDFAYLVMQTEPTFKVSDQHGSKRFGYVASLDLIYGATLGLEGAKKHIRIYNT